MVVQVFLVIKVQILTFHTILAKDEATLDMIENRIWELGFLAKLQPYEPLDLTSQG